MKLPIPVSVLDQNIIILGKTRSGKSSTMRDIGEYTLSLKTPVPHTLIDPKGDWWGLKYSADGKGPGFPIVIFGGEHADIPLSPKAGVALAEFCATSLTPVLIDVSEWSIGERTRFMVDFLPRYFKLCRGQRHYLYVDEVHNFCPKGNIPDPHVGKMLHWMNRFASEGLGRGINLIAASQRSQKVHNDFLTSCETLIALKVLHPADRSAVKDWLEGAGDKEKTAEIMGSLKGLKRGQGWVWSPESSFGPELIQFPLFTTYDSFKPQDDAKPLKPLISGGVDQIRERFAKLVQEAEAENPRALREKIVQLEQQLKNKATAPAAPTKEQLEEARRHGVSEAVNAATQRMATLMSEVEETLQDMRGNAMARFGMLAAELLSGEPSGRKPAKRVEITGKRNIILTKRDFALMRRFGLDPTIPMEMQPGVVEKQLGDAPVKQEDQEVAYDLTGMKQDILTAIAWFKDRGQDHATRSQIALWLGKSPNGGYFRRVLAEMASADLIVYPQEGSIDLGARGRTEVPDRPRFQSNLDAYRTHVRDSSLKTTILDTLVQGEMSREELAAAVGKSPNGGYFRRMIPQLITLGAIVSPSEGRLALSELAQH